MSHERHPLIGVDLVGMLFGRLVVVGRAPNHGKHKAWRCRCACGVELVVRGYELVRDLKQSCGCDRRRPFDVPTYRSWKSMICRCTKPTTVHYECYGGRGIRVCERWLSSFEAFVEDMGLRPIGLTLDRIDNDGNYEPGNVRWASRAEQAHNRRTNVVTETDVTQIKALVASGQTQAAVAKQFGIASRTVNSIVRGRRWSSIRGVS